MKLYRRPATPPPPFEVELVKEWDLPTFGAWQNFLAKSIGAAVSIAEYHLEDSLDHLVAVAKGEIVGSLQIIKDPKGRHHLHRLVVRPDYRNQGVAAELVRVADFYYDDVELWAYTADNSPLASLLDTYLFEEDTDAEHPETLELLGHDDPRSDGPADAAGGGGSAPELVDGQDAPQQDREAAGGPEEQPARRRRRGKRGGRRR